MNIHQKNGESDFHVSAARRILVDCSNTIFSGVTATGIPRVLQKYIEHGIPVAARFGVELTLVEYVDGDFRLYAFKDEARRRIYNRSFGAKVLLEAGRYVARVLPRLADLIAALVPIPSLRRSMARVTIASSRILPALRRLIQAPAEGLLTLRQGDILFCPGHWHDIDPRAYEHARASGVDVVFLVHDILPVTLAQYYDYPWRQKFADGLLSSFANVGHYYCVSGQTYAELQTFAAWHGQKMHASIAYNGFDPYEGPIAEVDGLLSAAFARRPWLMVGTIEPKKGHLDAIAVFERLWSSGYDRPLLIIGRRGWMAEPIIDAISRSVWRQRRLFWLEGPEDSEVAAAYKHSYGFLFPSLAEGFGIPMIEAAGYGTPILARDTPVAREILGDMASYFTNRSQMAERLLSFENEGERARATAVLQRFSWYSWRTVVEAVITDMLRPPAERDLNFMAALPREPINGAL